MFRTLTENDSAFLNCFSPPPLQLRRKRHPAGPAAGAAHGDEDTLLLLVVEVGALQHGAGLALEEFVERQVAGDDAVVGGERGGVLGRRGGGFSWRLFSFRWFRHYAVRKSSMRSSSPSPQRGEGGVRGYGLAVRAPSPHPSPRWGEGVRMRKPTRGNNLTSPPSS